MRIAGTDSEVGSQNQLLYRSALCTHWQIHSQVFILPATDVALGKCAHCCVLCDQVHCAQKAQGTSLIN